MIDEILLTSWFNRLSHDLQGVLSPSQMDVWGCLNHQQHNLSISFYLLQESQAEEAQEVGCLENHHMSCLTASLPPQKIGWLEDTPPFLCWGSKGKFSGGNSLLILQVVVWGIGCWVVELVRALGPLSQTEVASCVGNSRTKKYHDRTFQNLDILIQGGDLLFFASIFWVCRDPFLKPTMWEAAKLCDCQCQEAKSRESTSMEVGWQLPSAIYAAMLHLFIGDKWSGQIIATHTTSPQMMV